MKSGKPYCLAPQMPLRRREAENQAYLSNQMFSRAAQVPRRTPISHPNLRASIPLPVPNPTTTTTGSFSVVLTDHFPAGSTSHQSRSTSTWGQPLPSVMTMTVMTASGASYSSEHFLCVTASYVGPGE